MSRQKCFDIMERWLSGLKRTTGTRVCVNSASRVQIPLFPPKNKVPFRVLYFFVFKGFEWAKQKG